MQIPAEELVGNSYEKVRLWEEIAVSLLKKYTERYYTFRKLEWELPHLEYRTLEGDDTNFLGVKESPGKGYYRILIDKSQEDIVAKLEELKSAIQKGDLKPWEFRGSQASRVPPNTPPESRGNCRAMETVEKQGSREDDSRRRVFPPLPQRLENSSGRSFPQFPPLLWLDIK